MPSFVGSCLRGYWLTFSGDGEFAFADTAPAGDGCPLIVARALPGSNADIGNLTVSWPLVVDSGPYPGLYTAADGGSITLGNWIGCDLKYVVRSPPAPPTANPRCLALNASKPPTPRRVPGAAAGRILGPRERALNDLKPARRRLLIPIATPR